MSQLFAAHAALQRCSGALGVGSRKMPRAEGKTKERRSQTPAAGLGQPLTLFRDVSEVFGALQICVGLER